MSPDLRRSQRRRIVLAGTFLGVTALTLVLLRMSPQTSQGAGTSSLNGLVAAVNISFGGACNPGAIATPGSVSTGAITTPVLVPVTTPAAGCISRAGCPETVVIQNQSDPSKVERFAYANVSALTVSDIDNAGSVNFNLSAENLPPPPTTLGGCLEQHDLPATPTTNNCVLNFPTQGYLFVDSELLIYNGLALDTSATPSRCAFFIIGRGQMGTAAATHPPGSLIRAGNKLQLLGRGVPKYASTTFGWLANPTATPPLPTPTFAAHLPGAAVSSPKTYLTCRVLLSQPSGGANPVTATFRCYSIQQPGYNESVCATPVSPPAPAACFWPDGPSQQDAIRQWSVGYWSSTLVDDQIDHTTLNLTADVQPSIGNCFPYVSDLLWAKMTAQVTLQKTGNLKSYTGGTGTFAIAAYGDDHCVTSPIFILGYPNTDGLPNFVATPIPTPVLPAALPPVPTPDAADTDGDGCPDVRELGGVLPTPPAGLQTTGGLRDPFNPWDFPDMPIASNREKIRVDDVTFVVNRYRHDSGQMPMPSPAYDPKADHTVLSPAVPGQTWHLGPPNGQIRVDDVTAVVNQYRQDCS